MSYAWRKPSLVSPSVETTSLSVARLAPRAASSDGPPPEERIANSLPTMRQLAGPDHPIGAFLDDRQAAGFRARVNLQAMRMHDRLGESPIGESDGEGVGSMDDRATRFQ